MIKRQISNETHMNFRDNNMRTHVGNNIINQHDDIRSQSHHGSSYRHSRVGRHRHNEGNGFDGMCHSPSLFN